MVILAKLLSLRMPAFVDQDVRPAPGGERLLDHRGDCGLVGHRRVDCQRLTAGRRDLGRDPVRGILGEIVDHDLRTLAGEVERVRPSQPAARARHDRNPILKQHNCPGALIQPRRPHWRAPAAARRRSGA
jgi:hypothetical protein